MCAVVGLSSLPCMSPCFIRLITSVIQGMSTVATPKDPKSATPGTAQSNGEEAEQTRGLLPRSQTDL